MSSYVYLIIHRDSGRTYVGKANNPKIRWRAHIRNADTSVRMPLYCAMRKHGIEAFDFSVIEEHATEDEAYAAEEFFIEYLRWLGASLYNLTAGGEGVRLDVDGRAKLKASISAAMKRPEVRDKIKVAAQNRQPVSDETRQKLSAARKGRPHSPDHRANIARALKGKQRSSTHSAAISAALKGKTPWNKGRRNSSIVNDPPSSLETEESSQ